MDNGMNGTSVKQTAQRLVAALPDDASWDDLMYKIYVCQAIERGLEDVEDGRIISHEEVRVRFGLEP